MAFGASIFLALAKLENFAMTYMPSSCQRRQYCRAGCAAKSDPPRDVSKDNDALKVGAQLNLQFIVTGSYQSIGNQLLFDLMLES
jgi:hypothetical protein